MDEVEVLNRIAPPTDGEREAVVDGALNQAELRSEEGHPTRQRWRIRQLSCYPSRAVCIGTNNKTDIEKEIPCETQIQIAIPASCMRLFLLRPLPVEVVRSSPDDTTEGGTGGDAASTEGATRTVQPAKPVFAYEHVVILGVDGQAPSFPRRIPPMWTESSRMGRPPKPCLPPTSISAQCWGSMLHGVKPAFHRLTNDRVSNTPFASDSPYPSIFRILREQDADAELASFCNWNPINIGIVEEGLGVHKDTAGDPPLTEKILNYLDQKAPAKLMFVQFDSVDGAGHGGGYGSKWSSDSISAGCPHWQHIRQEQVLN